MAKTEQEINVLKKELEENEGKIKELTGNELQEVVGGEEEEGLLSKEGTLIKDKSADSLGVAFEAVENE